MGGNATGAAGWESNLRVCASALTGGHSGHQPKKVLRGVDAERPETHPTGMRSEVAQNPHAVRVHGSPIAREAEVAPQALHSGAR